MSYLWLHLRISDCTLARSVLTTALLYKYCSALEFYIQFKSITHCLIALALRKPRIQYNHYFYDIEKEFHFKRNSNQNKKLLTAIDLQIYEFANNLNIGTDSRPSAVEDIPVITID